MQAIFETLFDIVYLVTVIILGIRMICGSKGKKQYLLFGIMAVTLGCGELLYLQLFILHSSLMADLKIKRAGTKHRMHFAFCILIPTLVSRIHRREDDNPLDIQLCAGTFLKQNNAVRCWHSKNSRLPIVDSPEHQRRSLALQRYTNQRFALGTLLHDVHSHSVTHAHHNGFVLPVVWVDIKEPRSALRTGNFPGMLIKAFCRNLVFGHRYSCTRLCTTLTATPWI